MANQPEHRALRFDTLEDVVTEAERLSGAEVRTSGNHSLGQIIEHLARTHDMSTGKVVGPRPSLMIRLMMPFMKSMIINDKPMKPGFNLPKKAEDFFWPAEDFDVQEALSHLKESVANYKMNGPLPKHPVFGNLTPAENLRLNCQHAALHLGFVHPV